LLWVFCFGAAVKWKSPALAPVAIATSVIITVCVLQACSDLFPHFSFFNRLEWITYDWRAREAARHQPAVATNLGFVFMSDDSIEAVLDGSLPYRFGLHWPRQIHARVVNELTAQGAKAIGFDVVFAELRPDHQPGVVEGRPIISDDFFAEEIRKAGNVILAGKKGVLPHDHFRTNALAVADVTTHREVDSILRRAEAVADIPAWHPLLKLAAHAFDWDLQRARFESNRIIFPVFGGGEQVLPLGAQNTFDVTPVAASIDESKKGDKPRFEKAFTLVRSWQMGILLAARALGLDLDRAEIDRDGGRIIVPGTNGLKRVIPIDRDGRFYIDWSISPGNKALTKEGIEWLLDEYEARRGGRLDEITNIWRDKLVVIGSTATGNDLTDLGATPVEKETFLVSQHWNVANAVLLDRFITPIPLVAKLGIIVLLGMISALATWKMRTLTAVTTVALCAVGYVAGALLLFVQARVFLPIVLPVAGSHLLTHISLIVYLVRFEQKERRRTKDIFSKIVSPDVVQELLGSEKLALVGGRRHITVFFADIRGFTEMTDSSQQRAEEQAATLHLSDAEAEKHFDKQAAEVLSTVNLYLGAVADQVKAHHGTLDKYIGDCVMAFWGAPVANVRHASDYVRAVIAAQRAILALNQERTEENARRTRENAARTAAGEEALPALPLLSLGTGVNTGVATVGLMGSDAHIVNYTVFGREVNLASRLEGASGRGRILIGQQTYADLQRDAPDLAALCKPEPPLTLKGFRGPVNCYEVCWQQDKKSPNSEIV
jgi:class 3 adenylate cyclase/CHASE2 domain-containing sensor protein